MYLPVTPSTDVLMTKVGYGDALHQFSLPYLDRRYARLMLVLAAPPRSTYRKSLVTAPLCRRRHLV